MEQIIQKDFFEYGGTRIIINEHFRKEGKNLDELIEEVIFRQARTENRKGILPKIRAG